MITISLVTVIGLALWLAVMLVQAWLKHMDKKVQEAENEDKKIDSANNADDLLREFDRLSDH